MLYCVMYSACSLTHVSGGIRSNINAHIVIIVIVSSILKLVNHPPKAGSQLWTHQSPQLAILFYVPKTPNTEPASISCDYSTSIDLFHSVSQPHTVNNNTELFYHYLMSRFNIIQCLWGQRGKLRQAKLTQLKVRERIWKKMKMKGPGVGEACVAIF